MTEHSAVAVAPACLRLLGGWQLLVDGAEVGLGHREQRLISLLGLTDLTARARVASVLWPDSTDEHALGSLRRAVRQCQTKCPGVLVAARLTIGLDPAVRVDVDDLRRSAGLTRLPMGDLAAHDLLDALHGPELLPGWYDDWVVDERTQLEQLRVEALERIARHGLDEGDFALAVEASGVASAIEPLRESAREMSIRGHLGRGDVGTALHELQRYSAVTEEELGVAPPDRIRALLEPMLDAPERQQAPQVTVPRQRVAPPEETGPEPPPVGLEEFLAGGKRPSGVRRAGVALVGVAGLALAVSLAVALTGPEQQPQATTDPGEGAALVRPLTEPGDADQGDDPQPFRTVRVRLVESAAGSAAFAVRATPLPAEVRLVVRGRAGLRVVRHLVVRDADGRDVVVEGLDPGTYTWSATSASASQVSGEVSVTPVAEAVQPDASPQATVTPDVTQVASTPSQSPTTPDPVQSHHPSPSPNPNPNPTPTPSPSRSPNATPTDPGTVAPTPVG